MAAELAADLDETEYVSIEVSRGSGIADIQDGMIEANDGGHGPPSLDTNSGD